MHALPVTDVPCGGVKASLRTQDVGGHVLVLRQQRARGRRVGDAVDGAAHRAERRLWHIISVNILCLGISPTVGVQNTNKQ